MFLTFCKHPFNDLQASNSFKFPNTSKQRSYTKVILFFSKLQKLILNQNLTPLAHEIGKNNFKIQFARPPFSDFTNNQIMPQQVQFCNPFSFYLHTYQKCDILQRMKQLMSLQNVMMEYRKSTIFDFSKNCLSPHMFMTLWLTRRTTFVCRRLYVYL